MWQFPDFGPHFKPLNANPYDVQTWCGKVLPRVRGIVSVHFVTKNNDRLAEVKVRTPDHTKKVTLYEPLNEFPSDGLLGQVMLVAG